MPRKTAAMRERKRDNKGHKKSSPPAKVAKTVADGFWRASTCREEDLLQLVAERLLQEKDVVQWHPAGVDTAPWELTAELFEDPLLEPERTSLMLELGRRFMEYTQSLIGHSREKSVLLQQIGDVLPHTHKTEDDLEAEKSKNT
ncbi:hypothetical protein C2845_PM01G18470 [Panicum miliaceum]|uniref:Uncharacterized protein n=1 Tax=Panicum miliaceum TaxID=4540 RepID=A0A3L6TFK3_PANMI|nr:hypothetical protein C2845_PM01G18470 [Panicum miliaceum]